MNENITLLLNEANKEKIIPEVYSELLILAKSILKKSVRHETLDTSAIVHESLIKFYAKKPLNFESRAHFYALMAKIMRGLLIDYVRQKKAQRRGGDLQRITMTENSLDQYKKDFEINHLLDLDKAMQNLSEFDENLGEMFVMKFYAGLTIADLAKCYQISESTVKRELRTARAFIKSQLPDY